MNNKEEGCGCEEQWREKGCRGRFIEARVLLLLRKNPAHGYELLEKMGDYNFSEFPVDAGAVYKNLRRMEEEGLVKSEWDTKESGPAKRIYKITEVGEERLYNWIGIFKKKKEAIEKFLKTYESR